MGMGNVQRPGGPGKGGRGRQGMPQTAGYQGLIDKFAPPPAPSRRFGFPQEFQFGGYGTAPSPSNQFGGYGPPPAIPMVNGGAAPP